MRQIYKQYDTITRESYRWAKRLSLKKEESHPENKLRLYLRHIEQRIEEEYKEDEGSKRGQRNSLYYRVLVDRQVEEGRALHLFMPSDDLCGLIAESVRAQETHESLLKMDAAIPDLLTHILGNNSVVLHFRQGSKYPTLSFLIDRREGEEDVVMLCLSCNDMYKTYPVAIMITSKWLRTPVGHPSEHHGLFQAVYQSVCLIYGLGLYLNAFPDMLKDGVPSDLAHPSHHKYKRRMVVEDNKVLTADHHNGKLPHFRRGHFRTYQSERYVNVRLQVKWIEGVFIKGKAKHVDDATENKKE